MKRIYKYSLEITNTQVLALPEGAKILTVQMQGKNLCLWALVDPIVSKTQDRIFEIFGTGHDIEGSDSMVPPIVRSYLGTVQQDGGALVWHVFEKTN